MTKPLAVSCGMCGFTSDSSAEVLLHMVATGHGVPAEVAADIMDGGSGQVELTRVIDLIRADPEGENLPDGIEVRPVDRDDPDLPDEVRAFMDRDRLRDPASSPRLRAMVADKTPAQFESILRGCITLYAWIVAQYEATHPEAFAAWDARENTDDGE